MNRFVVGALKLLDRPHSIYVIVGFGLLLRVMALAMVMGHPLRNEAPGYHKMALQLLHDEPFSPYWPPGVPYYLLMFHRSFGESILVARESMIPVYAAFSFLLYLLTQKLSSRRAANLLALIFAVYPPYIRFSFNPSTEYPVATCLLAVVLLGILLGRNPSFALSAALGFFVGALILIRPSCMLFAAAVPLYLYLKTKRAWIAAVPLVVAALLVSAWLWKAHALAGRFVPINDANWENFYLGNNPLTPLYKTWPEGQAELGFPKETLNVLREVRSQPPAIQSRLYRGMAFNYILSRPDLFFLRTFNRARAYFGFPLHRGEPLEKFIPVSTARRLVGVAITVLDALFYWPIMVLALLFIFGFKNSSTKTDTMAAILGATLLYAIPYWVSFSQPRFNFPVVPLFGVLAAVFLDSLLDRADEDPVAHMVYLVKQSRSAQIALAVFFYIQIEWVLVATSIV